MSEWGFTPETSLVTLPNELMVARLGDLMSNEVGHLIAAAPDMLAAAREASALIASGLATNAIQPNQLMLTPDGDFELNWAQVLERLTAAISRAEGNAE